MPWQEDIETGRIKQFATAAEDSEAPTLPDAGTAITFSGDWTAADIDMADEEVTINPVEDDGIPVKPPLLANKVALLRDGEGIESIEITCFEIGTKAYTLATNASDAAGVWTTTATYTRIAVCIEFSGLGLLWMPSCEIQAVPPQGAGPRSLAVQKLVIQVFGTTAVPTGFKYEHYQDAS